MESNLSAKHLRELIRTRQWTKPTSGAATGYVQANLVMLPQEAAFNFLLFCVRNPKPCPILDVLEPGQVEPLIAPGADLRTDLPRYCIFENGRLKADVQDVRDCFHCRHGELPAGLQLFLSKTPCSPRGFRFATSKRTRTCPCTSRTATAGRPGRLLRSSW